MDHTLVIPTYNRPQLVRRLVAYYLGRNAGLNLLVLDSSKGDVAQANAQWLRERAPHVRHVVYPETLQPGVKLAQGMSLVETRHASFCADDDLVFLPGLAEAVRFLDANADYVCAHGLYLNFQIHDGSSEVNIWREYGGPGNEAGHPGARIFRLFQGYESLFYAAFRTEDLRAIFSVVERIPSLHYQELFQSVATLILGKVKRLACLYAARQSIAAAQPERDNWQTYYWFAGNAAELLEHYRNYCEDLWRFYEAHGAAPRLARVDFQKALDMAHAVYFSAACPPAYFHSVLQPLWPQDAFVEPGQADVFDQLGGKRAVPAPVRPGRPWSGLNLCDALSAAGIAMRAAYHLPHRLSLERRARQLGGTPRKCRLPWELRWLAGSAEFRATYLELCRYLDSR